MSNFIDNIQQKFTGRHLAKIPHFTPIETLSATVDCRPMSYERLKEYHFEVTWRMKVNIPEEKGAEEVMFANVLHQLKRDIYGDFIDDLLALERAVYGGEDKKVRGLVARLLSNATA